MIIQNTAQIGALIRQRRKAARLDLQTAATRAGVGRRLLLELEAGRRDNVSVSTLLRLLALFGLECHIELRGGAGR